MKKLITLFAAILFAATSCTKHKPIPVGDYSLNNDSTSVYKTQKLKTNLSITMRDGSTGEIYAAKTIDSLQLTGLKNFSLEDALSTMLTPNRPVVYAQYDDITVDRFLLRETKKTIYSYCKYDPHTKTINFWQDNTALVVTTEYMWVRSSIMLCIMLIAGMICASGTDMRMPHVINNAMVYRWIFIISITYVLSLFILYATDISLLLFKYKAAQWYELVLLYIASLSLPVLLFFLDLFIKQRDEGIENVLRNFRLKKVN